MGEEKDMLSELLDKLGVSGNQLQNVKLGPGIVGRNSSIAYALEVVALAGVLSGAYLHSTILVGMSLGGGVLVALGIAIGNIHFAKKNPAAALLEGAEFLEFHQMQMTASKGEPPTLLAEPPVPTPIQLSGHENLSLPEGGGQER